MSRILTNNAGIAYAIEVLGQIGVLPAQPVWKTVEPNDISSYGASISTVARNPISKNRQRRKGTITNLESAVEYPSDLTMSSFTDFIEGFAFSLFKGSLVKLGTGVTATGITAALSAVVLENALVLITGCDVATNNGLHVTGDSSGDTEIVIPVGLTTAGETSTSITVTVVGHRFATGDLEVPAATDTLKTTVQDLTALDIMVGQSVYVGGFADANQFGVAGTPVSQGLVRVMAITANAITFDKSAMTFTEIDGAGKNVDVFFGKFVRNVPTDHADFIERSYQFELALPGLDAGSATMYEYAKGNMANEISVELPLTDKAIVSVGFVGTDAQAPVALADRAQNADSATDPQFTTAFNTSADIARLRVDQVDGTGLTTDFKSLTITINNNVSPENVLGILGAKFMNAGNLEIGFEAELLFTEVGVVDAIRKNETLTCDFQIVNDDGTIVFDIPSLTLGGGEKSFPVNETVLISTTGEAFADDVLNTSMGITIFSHALPIDPANPFV